MEIENNRIAPVVTQISGQGAAVENQGAKDRNAASGEPQTASNTSDRVSLTGEARQLHQLESRIAGEPVVDRQRVQAIRSAIEDGSFSVNPHRIADKMLSLEQALTDAR
jgi:negative regulator of flagellin synthesis FlgM